MNGMRELMLNNLIWFSHQHLKYSKLNKTNRFFSLSPVYRLLLKNHSLLQSLWNKSEGEANTGHAEGRDGDENGNKPVVDEQDMEDLDNNKS